MQVSELKKKEREGSDIFGAPVEQAHRPSTGGVRKPPGECLLSVAWAANNIITLFTLCMMCCEPQSAAVYPQGMPARCGMGCEQHHYPVQALYEAL